MLVLFFLLNQEQDVLILLSYTKFSVDSFSLLEKKKYPQDLSADLKKFILTYIHIYKNYTKYKTFILGHWVLAT